MAEIIDGAGDQAGDDDEGLDADQGGQPGGQQLVEATIGAECHPETGAETLYSTIGYIIGIDGMDADFVREHIDRLPNFARKSASFWSIWRSSCCQRSWWRF